MEKNRQALKEIFSRFGLLSIIVFILSMLVNIFYLADISLAGQLSKFKNSLSVDSEKNVYTLGFEIDTVVKQNGFMTREISLLSSL